MLFSCDSYIPLSVPLGNRPLCFRTTVAGRDVLSTQTATMGKIKHGKTETAEYRTWTKIKERCYNANSDRFKDYGGRGIKVCDRWLHSFENFLADMGLKPTPKHSIERNQNDGDYAPDNCVWATPKQQGNNRRDNHVLTFNGQTLTVTEWAETTGIERNAIYYRLRAGWGVEKALSTYVAKHKS